MSRFSAIDLASYPIGGILDVLDFEAALARDRADFQTRWEARRARQPELPAFEAILLESDPASIVLEVGSYRETILGARINDRIRQLSLAGASGARLDHIGMTYYRTARLIVTPAANGQPAVLEDDESYRQRLALAPESWSTCGPEGAYLFWGATASGQVKDIAVFSEDEGCALAPTVRVPVLSTLGNGVPSADLLATVQAALSRRDRRPLGDRVIVEAAVPVPFDVAITLYVRAGASHAMVAAAARANVEAYLSGRRRWMGEGATGPYWIIGRRFRVQTIAAEAMVEGVEEVDVDLPADINAPAAGYAAALPLAWNAAAPLAAPLTEHLFKAPILGTLTLTTLPAESAPP